ncbi:MAG: glycosyltransferase family 2 protein [Acetatifactor sp.]|nr:glycosyltransferase family 2 protein [Acetatifactor sp.]
MITVSVCMIVKNEEKILARCLDSLSGLFDELIVVDTGSTDRTKEIAAGYTDRIYDFKWIGDFSAARNFAFSHAGCDYIYSADADEVLNEENREKFRILKENLDTDIEIVQMKYAGQLTHGTVYNFDEEYRPKLFKRLRTFTWIEPVHETVRTMPVVFDSDIVIDHRPESNHSGRDIKIFEKMISEGKELSKRLLDMYARELYLNGDIEELKNGHNLFENVLAAKAPDSDEFNLAVAILVREARLTKNPVGLLKYSSKSVAGEGNSEVCYELGAFYEDAKDLDEACIWYYNAAYETAPCLSVKAAKKLPLEGLVRIYKALGMQDQAAVYEEELKKI